MWSFLHYPFLHYLSALHFDLCDYKAIETVSDDNTHYEQNIILNDDLMLTLISVGMKQADILNEFISQVQVAQLQEYLEK